jgi:hypothetical protein
LSPSGKSAKNAVGYLRQMQQPGGGWRLGGNGALNTQSTAWAVEGLLAAGANPADFKRGGKSALEYLEDNQDADGQYRYSSKSDQTPVWVTGQVLVAAAKKYLPLEAPARAPKPKVPTPTPTPTPEPLPLPLPEEGGVAPLPTPTPEFPAEVPGVESSGSKADRGGGGKKGKNGQKGGPGGVGATPGGKPGATAPGTVPPALPIEGEDGEAFSTGVPAGGSDSDSGSGGSVLGSIIAGLIAGGILFAIGFGPYRRWKATHPKGGPPTNGGPAAPGTVPPAGPATPGSPTYAGGAPSTGWPPPAPPAINGTTPHAPVPQPPPPPRRYS